MAAQNSYNQYQGNSTPFLIQQADTVPATDTVRSYYSYLEDSLNFPLADTLFRFELREIILPDRATDSAATGPVYNMPPLFSTQLHHGRQIQEPIRRPAQGYDWLTILLLACVAILAWIRFYYTRRLKQLFRAVYARHHVNQLVRDGNLSSERISFGLGLILVTGVSTVILKLAGDNLSEMLGIKNSFFTFLVIAAALGLLWLLKLRVIKGVGSLFRTRQASDEYLLTNVLFNITAGFIAFPFIIAWHFSQLQLLLYVILAIFLIAAAMRMLRNISLGLSVQSFSVVYLFLYLCTLEILPFLFVYKYFTILDW
ncbi:MAG TPA: DUF4271 domain-containing protein [Lentimicrobium sp.]|nr:DUF4271 domain-containing protein [Lentimicrobium sp.]